MVPLATAGMPPSRGVSLLVTAVFATAMFILSLKRAQRTNTGGFAMKGDHFEYGGGQHFFPHCRVDSDDRDARAPTGASAMESAVSVRCRSFS